MRTKEQDKAYQATYRTANRETKRLQNRAWYVAHHEEITAKRQVWAATNKEEIKKYKHENYLANKDRVLAKVKQYYRANFEKVAATTRKRIYGISPEQQKELLTKPCSICGNQASHIDHCHKTKRVRGALCRNCNFMLGFAQDNPSILANGIKYLRNHNQGG